MQKMNEPPSVKQKSALTKNTVIHAKRGMMLCLWMVVWLWMMVWGGADAQVRTGRLAPSLMLRTVGNAKYFNLQEHVGKGVLTGKKAFVVSYFATWCEPCKKELVVLERLMNALACKQLDAVLVGTGRGQTEKHLLEFAREKALKLRVVSDVYGIAAKAWGVRGLPATFLLNGQGKVVARYLKYRPDFGRKLEKEIKKLLGNVQEDGQCEWTAAPARMSASALKPVVAVRVEKERPRDTIELDDLQEALRVHVARSGKYILVSEVGLQQAVKAQKRQMAGCYRMSKSCQLRLGRLLSAKYLLYGKIGKRGKRYRLSLTWLDLETRGEEPELGYQKVGETIEDLGKRLVGRLGKKLRWGIATDPQWSDNTVVDPGNAGNTGNVVVREPASKGYGGLRVRTVPSGATVLVDGVRKGVTPLTLRRVEAGERQVELSLKGYATLEKAVLVRTRGWTQVIERLSIQMATAQITTRPSGARVYVNGNYQGTTPYTLKRKVGKYQIKVALSNHTTAEGEVELKFGEVSRWERELAANPGRLRIRSVPSGAKVTVDGKEVGTTPLTVNNVAAGEREVKLEKDGYKWAESRIQVPAGGYRSWSAVLKKGSRYRTGQTISIAGQSNWLASFIPAGTFTMGSPSTEPKRGSDEVQHRVRISRGFWMMQTEVTQGQFQSVMGYNPSHFSSCGDNCPVEKVRWHEAAAFANALSEKENKPKCFVCTGSGASVVCRAASGNYVRCKGWRLPTEAEWEYAARAGTTTPFAITSDNCISTDQANYDGNYPMPGCSKGEYRGKTIAVGSLSKNAWGLYDMHGNVWEWVFDLYASYDVSAVLAVNPVNASRGALRVSRGGSWVSHAQYLRSAYRRWFAPPGANNLVGFRLARSLP